MPKRKSGFDFAPAFILTLICVITTGLLALTYAVTASERQRQEERTRNADRLLMFPQVTAFDALPVAEGSQVREALAARGPDSALLGYLVTAERRGYGGEVPILVAFSAEGAIRDIKVLANEETPGLGSKIADPGYIGQFGGRPAATLFTLEADSGRNPGRQSVDAISGATISSRAVVDALNEAVDTVGRIAREAK